ncbi:phage tail protein [Ferrovibrio sp.]|uniref:phage tail protein n=1 Tax=Ferrovibrio sp. TaxID=1917215 RepID=UPI003D295E9E
MDPFTGEIRIFGFNWAPRNWAICDATIIPIRQNQALFALLGYTYGGSVNTNFALPDLRGRSMIGQGRNKTFPSINTVAGKTGGQESVTLTAANLTMHRHDVAVVANTAANVPPPTSNLLGKVTAPTSYAGPTAQAYTSVPADPASLNLVTLDASTIGSSGTAKPIPTMQPSLVLNCCIATSGVFPTRP